MLLFGATAIEWVYKYIIKNIYWKYILEIYNNICNNKIYIIEIHFIGSIQQIYSWDIAQVQVQLSGSIKQL